jgi:hypothetical protein
MADVFNIQRCARPAAEEVASCPRALMRGEMLALVSMAEERDNRGADSRTGGCATGF